MLADIQEVDLPVHREQMAEDIEGWLVEQRKTEAVADIPGELGAAVVRVVSCEDHPWSSLTGNSPCCHRPVEAGGWVSGMGAEKVVYCLQWLLVRGHSHCLPLEEDNGHRSRVENADECPVDWDMEDIHSPVVAGRPIGLRGYGFGAEEMQQDRVVGTIAEAVHMVLHYWEVGHLSLKLLIQTRSWQEAFVLTRSIISLRRIALGRTGPVPVCSRAWTSICMG